MPRHRLALRAYATFHGQMLVGPYADPNQVELEAWAELRQRAPTSTGPSSRPCAGSSRSVA